MTLWHNVVHALRKVVRALGVGSDPGPLRPADRFEWERVVRRIQMPSGTKYLALTLSTYADGDGSRVKPGVERLVLVMGVSEKTVKRGFADLRGRGLVQLTKQGNRHAKEPDTHRLTVPVSVVDPMLDPDETGMSGGHQ